MIWENIFKKFEYEHEFMPNDPINIYQLEREPDNPLTKFLLHIYSLETDLPSEIQEANIN